MSYLPTLSKKINKISFILLVNMKHYSYYLPIFDQKYSHNEEADASHTNTFFACLNSGQMDQWQMFSIVLHQ